MTTFSSLNPATGEIIWQGAAANESEVQEAVAKARAAFPGWARLGFDARREIVERFATIVEAHKAELAETIARETGKPLSDSLGEAGSVIAKVAISIKAYEERTGMRKNEANGITQSLQHHPHGVMAVFGPYNFPAHLPNGHIVPALLAGNTVVFKPSEETPLVAETYASYWQEAGLPEGVLNVVQGAKETGIALAAAGIDGLLFTGSYATGKILHRQFGGRPEVILALEMGGNNPLVVWDAADAEAAAELIVQSAFITTGQRCTCARRLILPHGKEGDTILAALVAAAGKLRIGPYTDSPEPYMGPLINNRQADALLSAQADLQGKGGSVIMEMQRLAPYSELPFLTPGIIDVTEIYSRPDDEYFGPLLQVIRVADFEAALAEANNTHYGLAAGLISDIDACWQQFSETVRAGIINWNRPTTGASSAAPFGGIGHSGNHRPSAYYAADYCAYPVAMLMQTRP